VCSVVAACHKAVLWRRHSHRHAKPGTRKIIHGVREAGEVLVAGLWREILLETVEVVLLAFELVLLVVTQRLAVRAGFVCATMSKLIN
jgi:hypothetical protein